MLIFGRYIGAWIIPSDNILRVCAGFNPKNDCIDDDRWFGRRIGRPRWT